MICGVFCGPSVVFTNVLHPRAEVERKDEYAPTTVRRELPRSRASAPSSG